MFGIFQHLRNMRGVLNEAEDLAGKDDTTLERMLEVDDIQNSITGFNKNQKIIDLYFPSLI